MCIIQNKARSLAIKKMLGIKLVDRYKWEGLVALALYAIQLLVVLIFGSSKLILIFALIMIALDALISSGFISIVERRSLPAMLKGE
jgi:fucose permease